MADENPADRLKEYRFQPGQSGNPSGRAKGLERRTRDLLGDDIDALTYVQRCIALGVPPELEQIEELGIKLTDRQKAALGVEVKISRRDQLESYKALSDRGWGKPKQVVKFGGPAGKAVPKNMPKMTDEQLRTLAALDADLGDESLDDEIDESDGVDATQH